MMFSNVSSLSDGMWRSLATALSGGCDAAESDYQIQRKMVKSVNLRLVLKQDVHNNLKSNRKQLKDSNRRECVVTVN